MQLLIKFKDKFGVKARNNSVKGALQRIDSEAALREHQCVLESLLEQRATELQLLNDELRQELAERRRAERKATNIAQQLEDLMNTAPIIIARADLNTKITYINQKCEELTGYTQEEAIGRYWTTAGVIPSEFVGAMVQRTAERLLGRTADGMEIPLKCKDGRIKYFKGVGQIIKENGKPVAVQVLAYDITQQRQSDENTARMIKRLAKTLEDMISAMVTTMELKDPYTAGHQRKVAQLACAIAVDIGLIDDQLLGIKLAGLVHDMGKICLPAEILTYPGKLNEAQMQMIKMHPAVGYEILKNIDFNWPIANAVLQHHERLDGSGYPSGLTDKEIAIEAKILAIADVVEAMSSHRPYRPALGFDAAFNEIQSHSGKLYDTEVVNSCLKLFRKKGFKFDDVNINALVNQ